MPEKLYVYVDENGAGNRHIYTRHLLVSYYANGEELETWPTASEEIKTGIVERIIERLKPDITFIVENGE